MKKTTFYIWLLLSILLIMFLINYFFLYQDTIEENTNKYRLRENGVQVIKKVFDSNDISNIKTFFEKEDYNEGKKYLLNNQKLNNLIHTTLSKDYRFQDYIWIIKKSVVHTCHRDNNGDFFNEKQMHPSYTLLVYLEDMEKCLGVVPDSHKSIDSYNYNLSDPIIDLPCKKGDVIIFNANLIHVGCINKKDDNLRIQLKVTHKDDIQHLQYYQNFNKILNKDNTLPQYIRKAQKRMSCMVPAFSDSTQSENIRTARGSSNGVNIGIPLQIFSYLFYGDTGFYDLPNAF